MMIGNAVLVQGKPYKIKQIAKRRVGYCPMKSPNLEYAKVADLEPIKITEEFLHNNGFDPYYDDLCECNGYIREIDGFNVDIQFGNANMGDDYVVCHIDTDDRRTAANADIKYVHQMQNLLSIMNIKWEVHV